MIFINAFELVLAMCVSGGYKCRFLGKFCTPTEQMVSFIFGDR